MRIKKTSQYMEGGASLSNEYGTSDSNGYTQEYINPIKEKTDRITTIDNTMSGSATSYNYTMNTNGSLLVVMGNNMALLYFGINTSLGRYVLLANVAITGTITATDNNNGILTVTIPSWRRALIIEC